MKQLFNKLIKIFFTPNYKILKNIKKNNLLASNISQELSLQQQVILQKLHLQEEVLVNINTQSASNIVQELSLQQQVILQELSLQQQVIVQELSLQQQVILQELSLQQQVILQKLHLQEEVLVNINTQSASNIVQELSLQQQVILQKLHLQEEVLVNINTQSASNILQEAILQKLDLQKEVILQELHPQQEVILQRLDHFQNEVLEGLEVLRNFIAQQSSLNQISLMKVQHNGLELFFKIRTTSLRQFKEAVREIFYSGGYKLKDTIDFKENDIFIDVGANVGVFTCYLAKKYPFIKIHAFEPSKENYDLLLENISINKLTNVTTYKKALFNNNGTTNILYLPHNTGGSHISDMSEKDIFGANIQVLSSEEEQVDTINLDTLFNNLNIQQCKYLKLDCEGGEIDILTTSILPKVEYISIGLHYNTQLNNQIIETAHKYINANKIERMNF